MHLDFAGCSTFPEGSISGVRGDELARPQEMDMNTTQAKGTALITGASTGIGATYADRLAKRGCDLIIVARNEEKLKALSARLTSETGQSIAVLPADLSNKADLAKVEATLRDDPSITLFVNNAGVASVAPLLDADVNKMDAIIDLNITVHTPDLCCRASTPIRRRPSGLM